MFNWIHIPALSQYSDVILQMDNVVNKIIEKQQNETIFLVEHDDTYTAGTSAKEEDLISPGDIPVINVGRGGKYTYHGPGQRVIYPVINLALENRKKDIKFFLTSLQDTVIKTLDNFNVKSYACSENIGIWVPTQSGDKKIASIGIRVKKWVTYHGIAININPDLDKFNGIIPCGINSNKITSLKELGFNITLDEFDLIYKKVFQEIFG